MKLLPVLSLILLAVNRPPEPVALVYSLTGTATLSNPARPLRRHDRLPPGAVIEVGPASRLALAFASGARYELGEGARATLGKSDLASRAGLVKALPWVPPFPILVAISESEKPGAKAGAVRIRGEEIDCLSPRDGAATLADATVLRFRQVDGASRYQVEVEDGRGNVVFRTVTESSLVRIPAGTLAAGARYHWTVKTLARPGPVARGQADFVTLSRKAAADRERLREAVEAEDDGRELLDAVDRALGMAGESCPEGVVVESVAPGSPGEAAGLQPGDRLLSWSCRDVKGQIRFPSDLSRLDTEEAARCAVILEGRRGDEERRWMLAAAEWKIRVRPDLPAGLAGIYLEGRARLDAGDLAGAGQSWRAAAEAARNAGDNRLAAWLLARLAGELAEAGKGPESDIAFREALDLEPEPAAAAELLNRWGMLLQRRSDWDASVERLQEALELYRRSGSASLAEARAVNNLGLTAAKRGDYAAAEPLLKQALEIREKLAPGTAEVTASLNNLGILARVRGDLDGSGAYLARAEQIQSRLAPESADHALVLQNLGNLAMDRGDLEAGERFFRRALAIFERTGSDRVRDCLSNLANVAIFRGDLATADELLQRSVASRRASATDELAESTDLVRLGVVASRRGDLDGAEAYYRRALEIQETLSPNGPEVTVTVQNLGMVFALKGDLAAARAYLRRSLEISRELAPDQLDTAFILDELARIEMGSGDLATAEDLLRQAQRIIEKQAPGSVSYAELLRHLGEVADRRGRFTEAIALHRRALDLQRSLAPGTTGEAEALHALGRSESRAGLREDGVRDVCRAIDVLDSQRGRIGGTQEARGSFEVAIGDYYETCLDGLMQIGRPAEAFKTLERGRARSFLALLSDRDLHLSGLPPELDRERRHNHAAYDRVQSQLAGLSAGRDQAGIERLTGELRELRNHQEQIVARIRRESPRSAAIEHPEPLDLAGARAALDPGTVFLAYAVGAEATWLFVVQSADAGVPVYRIPISARALREEVEGFRRLLERPGSDRSELRARGRRLYSLLVGPAEGRIARAQRILVSPDGPLHVLPFAALWRRGHYLVEWKPIHSVLSGTVYAELTRSRPAWREPGDQRLAAFGDPVYPSTSADPDVREAVERGLALKPIPASRTEVEAIASLYPRSDLYLGRDATEERAKSLGPGARFVHFACHGLIDERFPLNSALALTFPESAEGGRDNGLLQAWEIFEQVRLDADLVTLSACDTGLGKEMGGEGLVGLVRAFQFAGARSVLASQWGVSDEATAGLMKRFYSHLRKGESKDQALRSAQNELIHSQDFAHPYYWAAFQLTGDWQ